MSSGLEGWTAAAVACRGGLMIGRDDPRDGMRDGARPDQAPAIGDLVTPHQVS